MAKQVCVALVLGLVITFVLFGVGALADAAGFSNLASLLFWQNFALQALVPLHNIGTPEQPFMVATPLNVAVFFASFPLGVVIYGSAAFFVLYRRKHHA